MVILYTIHMPRGFSEREREAIRERLLAAGRDAFGTYGLKKTSVDEVTRAVGISKGAFYLFHDSKEALFLDILDRFEAEFQARVLERAFRPGLSPAESFRELVVHALTLRHADPLLQRFDADDLAHLLRRIPPEQAEVRLNTDVAFLGAFVERWRERGVELRADPRVLAGLLRALFFISLHRDDLGADSYPAVMDVLIAALVARIVPRGRGDRMQTGREAPLPDLTHRGDPA